MTKETAKKASKKISTEAYNTIKQDIMLNRIKQGEFILENGLAKQLKMSRSPVREAIRLLSEEGIVEPRNGVGIYVRDITNKELHDIFEMRALFECTAVKSAMSHITKEDIDEWRELWLGLLDRLKNGEGLTLEEIASYDDAFHSLFINRCENEILKKMVADMHHLIVRSRIISIVDLENTINQHLQILDCMEHKSVDCLVELLRNHIEDSMTFIMKSRYMIRE